MQDPTGGVQNTHEDKTDHPVPDWINDEWWFPFTREDNFS